MLRLLETRTVCPGKETNEQAGGGDEGEGQLLADLVYCLFPA